MGNIIEASEKLNFERLRLPRPRNSGLAMTKKRTICHCEKFCEAERRSNLGFSEVSIKNKRTLRMNFGKILCFILLCFSTFCFGQEKSASLEKYDLAIYGGTSAGVIAAVKGACLGMSVVLIEPSKHLGGLTASGLGLTDAGKTESIGGLAKEFYKRTYSFYNDDDSNQCQWRFEPHVAEAVFNKMLAETNARILLGERLDLQNGVVKDNNRIVSIKMESGQTISARIYIDASYEGDLMAKAGVSYTTGRESNSKYNETLNGIQIKNAIHHQFFSCIATSQSSKSDLGLETDPNQIGLDGEGDKRIQAYCYRLCLTDNPSNMVPFQAPKNYNRSKYELLLKYLQSLKTYESLFTTDRMPNFKTDSNNKGPFSLDYIGMNYDYPEGDYKTRSRIEAEHENYQRGFLYFLANDACVPAVYRNAVSKWGLAKDEFTDSNNWPYKIYIREARRMVSDFVITEHHCMGGQIAADSIGLASYPMDSHNVRRYVDTSGCVKNEGDVQVGGFKPYPISYRTIIPPKNECTNLLVPVCVSSSHIAYGSIRMEPVFMILGESAATAAYQAVKEGVSVQDVNYNELRVRLLRSGQVLKWHKNN